MNLLQTGDDYVNDRSGNSAENRFIQTRLTVSFLGNLLSQPLVLVLYFFLPLLHMFSLSCEANKVAGGGFYNET